MTVLPTLQAASRTGVALTAFMSGLLSCLLADLVTFEEYATEGGRP